ncbi:hypothetical protein EON81_09610 [bacterium]|nr:MAG: hypothetical protein EON81_09610 [bacterium]
MRKMTTLSAFALVAFASGQSPLWTQVEGAPAIRLRDASVGVSLRWDLGSTQPRLTDLTTQLQSKAISRNASGIYDASPDGKLFALARIADNGDGTESYYIDVARATGDPSISVFSYSNSESQPSTSPERVFFTQDSSYLAVQYWADTEGNLAPSISYTHVSGGNSRSSLGRMVGLPEGNKGLLTKANGTFRLLNLVTGGESAFPTVLPVGFKAREARGDWILGQTPSSVWVSVRRSDGFQRTIVLGSNEIVIGLAWEGKVVVVSNPSTGQLRYVGLANGLVRALPTAAPGPVSLSPDRTRLVLPLVDGRKGLLRISDEDLKISDERSWMAGLDASSRAWMVSPRERRVRNDSGAVVETMNLVPRPGTMVWTDGTLAIDRIFENSKEAYYKVVLSTGARSKWFEVTPSTGAFYNFFGHQKAIRHHVQNSAYQVTAFNSAGVATQPAFPHGEDYLSVQGFLPDGQLYGTYSTGEPYVSSPTYFVVYNGQTGQVTRRIYIGLTGVYGQASVNANGTLALVPTLGEGRLVNLATGTVRILPGQAAGTWQASLDAAQGHPLSALSGDGTVLFLASGAVGGFFRVSDGRKLATAPLNSTAILSADGRRALVNCYGTKSLFAIPATP